MKKFVSILLLFTMLFSLSISASADNTESVLHIPSPEEIEEYYKNTIMEESSEYIEANILSCDLDKSDLLLLLGAVCSYAEGKKDITAIHTIANQAYRELMPILTDGDYVKILSNKNYTNTFRFAIMDIYSYDLNHSRAKTADNFYNVDCVLKEYIAPNNPLVVDAIASIHDKSIIGINELSNILVYGDLSARQIALRTMCQEYPDDAFVSIQKILSLDDKTSILYRSAINFLPRLVGKADGVTEDVVLKIVDDILEKTNDDYVKITCVQALEELNSESAAMVLSNHLLSIPSSLIDYYNSKSSYSVKNTKYFATQPRSLKSTSNRLGHAVYRDGVPLGQWHTGIVAHIYGPEYTSSGNWIAQARGLNKTTGYNTFTEFMTNSAGETGNYIAERYISSMTSTDHYNIFYTADDLATEGIPYTAVNLISVSLLAPTNIAVSDINKIRCDGFVEYAYEYNNIQLQGSTYWNISTYLGAMNHDGLLMTPTTQYNAFDSTNPR